MEIKFKYLEKEKILKEKENFNKKIEIEKKINEFLLEMQKNGNKSINKKIKDMADEYFKDYENFSYAYYYNNTESYGTDKYYTKSLTLKFKDDTKIEIYFQRCWGSDNKEVLKYSEIFEMNNWLSIENIEKNENEQNGIYEKALEKLEIYNKKLKELEDLRKDFYYETI